MQASDGIHEEKSAALVKGPEMMDLHMCSSHLLLLKQYSSKGR